MVCRASAEVSTPSPVIAPQLRAADSSSFVATAGGSALEYVPSKGMTDAQGDWLGEAPSWPMRIHRQQFDEEEVPHELPNLQQWDAQLQHFDDDE